MWLQRNLITLATAILLHAGLAYSLSRVPPQARPAPHVVELAVSGPPPPLPPPAPPVPPTPLAPASPPSRKAAVKRRASPAARPSPRLPTAAPPPPTAAPTRPLFGVTMDSITEGPSSVAVPLGDSTLADARAPRESSGPPAPPPPPERPYKPVSSLAVKVLPEIDAAACGRGITYPKQARALGLDGDVVLRVELEDTGKVRRVYVVSGLGHGLDQAAVAALTHACKFTPALDQAGQPVAYVIPAYTFHFELPR